MCATTTPPLASRNPTPPRTFDAISMQGTHTHHHHTITAPRSDFLPLVRWVRYPNNGIFLIIPAPHRQQQSARFRQNAELSIDKCPSVAMQCHVSHRRASRPQSSPNECSGLCLALGRATGHLGDRGRGPNVTLTRSSNVAVAHLLATIPSIPPLICRLQIFKWSRNVSISSSP